MNRSLFSWLFQREHPKHSCGCTPEQNHEELKNAHEETLIRERRLRDLEDELKLWELEKHGNDVESER